MRDLVTETSYQIEKKIKGESSEMSYETYWKHQKRSKPCIHTGEIWVPWVLTSEISRAWNSLPDKNLNSKKPRVFFTKEFFWGHVVRKEATWEQSILSMPAWAPREGGSKVHQERKDKLGTPNSVYVALGPHATLLAATRCPCICYQSNYFVQETHLKTSPFKYCLHHHRFTE